MHFGFYFGCLLILQAVFDKATSHTKAMLQKTEEEKRTLEKVTVGVSFRQRGPWLLKRGYQTVYLICCLLTDVNSRGFAKGIPVPFQ